MALTERQVALIRESFRTLRDDPRPKSIEFYETFFRFAPELREMFREDDLGGQGMRFMGTLAVIVDNLDNPDAIADRFASLGRGHKAMGVTARHFVPMGKALFETLNQELGDAFSDETRAAWEVAYAEVSAKIVAMGDIPKE